LIPLLQKQIPGLQYCTTLLRAEFSCRHGMFFQNICDPLIFQRRLTQLAETCDEANKFVDRNVDESQRAVLRRFIIITSQVALYQFLATRAKAQHADNH
jgi:hypothetical protein